jgi:sugar transferase (PEP-CTERM system associated)
MPKLRLSATSTALAACDAALVALAWPLALWAADAPVRASDPSALLYPGFDLLFLYALGLYRRDALIDTRQACTRVPLAVGLGVLAAAAGATVLHACCGAPAAAPFGVAIVCFTFCALAARLFLGGLRQAHVFRRHLLVVGAGKRAWDLVHMLRKEGRELHYDIAFAHAPVLGEIDPRLRDNAGNRVIAADDFDILAVAEGVGADIIVIAPDERRGMQIERLLDCRKQGFPVVEYLSFVEREIRRIDIKRLELSWVLYSPGFSFSLLDRVLKRVLDVMVSLLIMVPTAPFVLAAMAAIKLEDGGPVFYRQERVTRDGKLFRIAKLRTMRVDAERAGAVWAGERDDRITGIGRFLRRTRLDEVPQLVNVLRGDMSLVGPRPERPGFVRDLAAQIPLYNERHMVKAGLTGWAQVNYPYGASVDDARSKLSYDLYYVKNFSVLFDLLILLQTLRVVLFPSGGR